MSEKLRMFTGSGIDPKVSEIDATFLSFVTADGRILFQVQPGKDGRSVEIRGAEVCKVNGMMCGTRLEVLPEVTNSLAIRARAYDD